MFVEMLVYESMRAGVSGDISVRVVNGKIIYM